MTIDPKAAELAKALADAVAAQQTEEYQALAEAAKRKAEIDATAEAAAKANRDFYNPPAAVPVQSLGSVFTKVWDDNAKELYESSEPERYELPEDNTISAEQLAEFETPKPNGGLPDYD